MPTVDRSAADTRHEIPHMGVGVICERRYRARGPLRINAGERLHRCPTHTYVGIHEQRCRGVEPGSNPAKATHRDQAHFSVSIGRRGLEGRHGHCVARVGHRRGRCGPHKRVGIGAEERTQDLAVCGRIQRRHELGPHGCIRLGLHEGSEPGQGDAGGGKGSDERIRDRMTNSRRIASLKLSKEPKDGFRQTRGPLKAPLEPPPPLSRRTWEATAEAFAAGV